MKIAWATDIHLNFLDRPGRQDFYRAVEALGAEAVAVSGDIAESPTVVALLEEMAWALTMPIYFVLGNHDTYPGERDAGLFWILCGLWKPTAATGVPARRDYTQKWCQTRRPNRRLPPG